RVFERRQNVADVGAAERVRRMDRGGVRRQFGRGAAKRRRVLPRLQEIGLERVGEDAVVRMALRLRRERLSLNSARQRILRPGLDRVGESRRAPIAAGTFSGGPGGGLRAFQRNVATFSAAGALLDA